MFRVYGRFKQQLWGSTSKTKEVEGLELKSPIDKNPSNWPSSTSSTSFDKKKVSEFNKSVVELVHQRRDYRHHGEELQQGASVSTTGPSSFQSSPKSISSGIGVSEKENFSDNVDEEEEDMDAVEYGNPVNEGGPI